MLGDTISCIITVLLLLLSLLTGFIASLVSKKLLWWFLTPHKPHRVKQQSALSVVAGSSFSRWFPGPKLLSVLRRLAFNRVLHFGTVDFFRTPSCLSSLSSRLKQCFSPHRYGGVSFSFSNLINGVTERFSTDFELQQVRDTSPESRKLRACSMLHKWVSACSWRHFTEFFCFFCQQLLQFKKDNADVGFGSGTSALDQSIERTRANIKWISENKQKVLEWLQEQTKGLDVGLWLFCTCPFTWWK